MEPKKPTTLSVEETKTEVETEEPEVIEPKGEPKVKTVEEILTEGEKESNVPLSVFLETKKEKKALEREIAELKEKANSAPKAEVTADLNAIADKYDVDPNFLEELSTLIYTKAKGEADQTLKDKLKPIEEKERSERIDKAFSEHFTKVMEEMPEFNNVVNRDVIKELSLLPQNSKKTFQQIIEETYGKTITGKKTFEPTTPRGGKDASIDKSRLNEPEYFKEVMSNPELKKEYNKSIQDRIQL